MHHLIQGTLALLGLEGLGLSDLDSDSFVRIFQQWNEVDFREIAREKFISHWREQIESGGTTIGVSLTQEHNIGELSLLADHIIELRNKEMGGLTLSEKDDEINLEPLYLTAYGYQILRALKAKLTCSKQEFESISRSLDKLNFTLQVKDHSLHEEFSSPSRLSTSLIDYIFRLVEPELVEED